MVPLSGPFGGPRFLVRWTRGCLQLLEAATTGGSDGVVVNLPGAVWGLVSTPEAHTLVDALTRRRVDALPERPWLALAVAGDSLVVSCSPMLPSGAFWGLDATGGLVVASDPISVARLCAGRGVDEGFVRSYLFGEPSPTATAFPAVSRLEPGYWATWSSPGQPPMLDPWCGPEVWDEPHLRGQEAIDRYVAALDRVVEEALPHVGAPVVAVSGGLDSTFVASSVSRAGPKRSVLALHSGPLPAVPLARSAGRDADETALAEQMAQVCGFDLRTVANARMVHPLDAAAGVQSRTGVPSYAPANQIWLSEFDRIAASMGARAWFTGWHGNASFSYGHGYAEEYYLRRGRIPTTWGLLPGSAPGKAKRLARLSRHLASNPGDAKAIPSPLPGVPPWQLSESGLSGRQRWLRWLAFRGRPHAAARNPAAGNGIVCVDPFAAPSVLAVAAAIEPSQWRRPELTRAFARLAGRGRVPDSIRLRTLRGQQSSDMWYFIRNERDGYLDRVRSLGAVPGMEAIDVPTLLAHIARWPWGKDAGPPLRQQTALDRILAMADFVRTFSRY